jgi:hypothetical protein
MVPTIKKNSFQLRFWACMVPPIMIQALSILDLYGAIYMSRSCAIMQTNV